MGQNYASGKRIHAFLGNIAGTDTVFSWYDDDGNAYTLKNGDRIIIDALAVVQGAASVTTTVYFDYAGTGAYVATSGEEVFVGALAIGAGLVFPIAASMGGKRNMNGVVNLRAVMSATSAGATINVTARVIQT